MTRRVLVLGMMAVALGCGSGAGAGTGAGGAGTGLSKAPGGKGKRPTLLVPAMISSPLVELVPCPSDVADSLAARWQLGEGEKGEKVEQAGCAPGRFPRVSWVTLAELSGPKGRLLRYSIWDVHSSIELARQDEALSDDSCVGTQLEVADLDGDAVDEVLWSCVEPAEEGEYRHLFVLRVRANRFERALDLDHGWSAPVDERCDKEHRITDADASGWRELVVTGTYQGTRDQQRHDCELEQRISLFRDVDVAP
ncbi:MAG: hypothetical protein IT370_28465 [Deltaproteobacteria bacterium]|nr:hypothetical protein [Deltaproteobacteria bacterium]